MVEPGSPTRPHRGRIKDARGRLVTQIDPITMHALHRPCGMDRSSIETVLNDLERGLARQLTWRSYVLRVLFGLSVGAIAFSVFWLIGDSNFRAAIVKVYTSEFVIWLPLVICAFVVPLMIARRRHRGRVLQALLKHHLCPHCGYILRELPVEPEDGATVCPECGCAWMLHETTDGERDDDAGNETGSVW